MFDVWGHVDTMGNEITEYTKRITKRTGKREGLQLMRRSFCTYVLGNGVSAATEADWSGHSAKTAEGYYRGKRPIGERILLMTYKGKALERHGVSERMVRAK
jgi:hypothetical protein